MQVSDLVAQAITVLSSYVAGIAVPGTGVVQGVAAQALAKLVEEQLRQDGHGGAWDSFVRDQGNASAVEDLLKQASDRDANFRTRLDAAMLRVMNGEGQAAAESVSARGPSRDQVGHNIAISGHGSYVGRDANTTSTTNVKSGVNPLVVLLGGAVAVVVALVLIVNVIGALLGGLKDGGLTADSTCQQFLNVDQQTEAQAIVDIAMAKGLGGFGSPLALPAVRYNCSSQPDAKLGDVIQKFKGQF